MSSKKQSSTQKKCRNSGTGRNKADLGNTKTKSVEDLKHRAYCWTLNNYTEEEVESLKRGGTIGTVEKMIFNKEIGPEEGTPHLQGFTRFANPISWTSFKKANPRMSFRVVKGDDYDNYKYCCKDGIEHCVGMEKEAAEHKRRLSGYKPQEFKGYSCIEELMENTPLEAEKRMWLEEEARMFLEEKKGIDDEPYKDEIELELSDDEE